MCCTLLIRWSMVLVTDIKHGCGLSYNVRPLLQPKKINVRLY